MISRIVFPLQEWRIPFFAVLPCRDFSALPPTQKNALAESARAQACSTFSGSLTHYRNMHRILFFPKVWRKQKSAPPVTGGALDFSYLGKCFILRLRQNYLRGLLIAA